MNEAGKVDLSSLTFEEFVRFLFQRPVEHKYWYLDPEYEYGNIEVSSPPILIDHATRLFTDFGTIGRNYFLPQIDHGVWALLGDSGHLSIQEFLWNSPVPLEKRVLCIGSMFHVYFDFVVGLEEEPGCFYMWWDELGIGFWSNTGLTPNKEASLLNQDQMALLDAMFETLKLILELKGNHAERCALHGLGHLHHPEVRGLVQSFIDRRRNELDQGALRWLEQCRDGTVM